MESHRARVYEMLIERIRQRKLVPGTRLREEEIASSLNVSRTPVREALARLQARGLVEQTPSGMIITELDRRQIMELYAMRAALEGASARFAAENATPADIEALARAAELFESCNSDSRELARANKVLHDMIAEATHNRYLARMLDDLNDSLALLSESTFSQAGRAAAAIAEHAAIVAAIKAHDPAGAEAAARTHIENARQVRLAMTFR